jgi:anti-sigma factor RsiW
MCNKERLLDYLYDELPAGERTAVERHLYECTECRTELAELGGTRLALSSWSPPDSELGFRIVRNVPPAPRRAVWAFGPAWGLAAAAVLVLAAAAAVAHVELRYDDKGVMVRTGWGRDAGPAPTAAGAAVPAAATSEEWKDSLRLLDTRLQQLEQSVSGSRRVSAAVDGGGTRMSDAQILHVVRQIVADSEGKQQRELALRVTQVIRDFDTTRATDLARVEQGLQKMQGLTDAELIRHRDTLNHLLRVTQR